ncbi:hypothetical protein PC129_g8723 [Phytophthora cactorum]|uniref:Uncharacterized protein n=1 Tax=Phytophthora cactorum TaxID=29920 RepID=A0A8T1L1W0_9STRA|nr:hypothetical protein PC112_g9515 [Phytophthora cactorum]KAG2833187.1 hypothetical protein PC111_g6317 [Phytophthora cactorum]KAG2856882.1 hypothetical protein PC113_g11194 [Phytophthora cactorum]KAG2905034.1 hypothetical protein PC114_g11686 [Phytophthora cactorum]KAG2919844.1 hypothetical protein PC115_g10002 [Phytophthora cactorum]
MAGVEVFATPSKAQAPTRTLVNQAMPRVPLWRRVEEKWDDIQIGRQGSYSVERLESLELYYKTTSKTRAVMVCLFTPLPALSTAVLLECLPLQPPSEGWTANWVFWIRVLLVQFILDFVVNSQMIRFIPGLNFTFGKRIVASVGVSTAFVGTGILAASTIGFPVPLMMQFAVIPIPIYALIMTLLVLGTDLFAKDSPFKDHFDRYNRFFFAFMTMSGVFPIYKVLYEAVPVAYQIIVVAILPIVKFAAKHFLLHPLRELVDVMPVLVAFSVDFMTTLFIAVCMSTSGSLTMTILFIAADFMQSWLEFREMRSNSRALMRLLDDKRISKARLQQQSGLTEGTDILSIIVDVVKNSGDLRRKSLDTVRLWACLPQSLTREKAERLQALEASGVYNETYDSLGRKKSQSLQQPSLRQLGKVSVAPTPKSIACDSAKGHQAEADTFSPRPEDERSINSKQAERAKALVVQGLQILFHSEYLILVEYVECMVPLILLVFKSILEQLPNIVYYPGGAGQWGRNAVANMLLLVVLEVGSLLFLNAFLQRKFAFSPLYQLAFVLESEMYPVQAIFFIQSLILLQFELEHFGADFSLEFKWLREKGQ